MTMSKDSQSRMEALENLERIARAYTRHMFGPHLSGHQEQGFMLLEQMASAIHELDRVEGCELPVGHAHKWQEVSTFPGNPKPGKDARPDH